MISLLLAFAILIIGYFAYGRVTEKIFAPDDRPTPAVAINDGVDCVPMKTWKAFLIQLLNIAGTGPIFGALMGAVFGPVVFLWIVFGSILGGAVHDYMSGMISCRHGGASIAELSGTYLGNLAKWVMRIFSVVLLVLCGTVFVTSPAGLLDKLTPPWMNGTFWALVILAYYLLATLLPMDKLIGRLYPIFGVLLIVMAGAVIGNSVLRREIYHPRNIFKQSSPCRHTSLAVYVHYGCLRSRVGISRHPIPHDRQMYPIRKGREKNLLRSDDIRIGDCTRMGCRGRFILRHDTAFKSSAGKRRVKCGL